MLSEGRAKLGKLERLEIACLEAVRGVDKGTISAEMATDTIEELDKLITENRKDIRPQLLKTLQAKPWQRCPCDICRKDGVEVIIFRGNNRNRRRGFHNTFHFYRTFQRILNGEKVKLGWGFEEDDEASPGGVQQTIFSSPGTES